MNAAPLLSAHLRTLRPCDLERAAEAAAERQDAETWQAVLDEHARRDAEDKRPTLPPPGDEVDDEAPLFVGGVVDATPLSTLAAECPSHFEEVCERALRLVKTRGVELREAIRQSRAEVCS